MGQGSMEWDAKRDMKMILFLKISLKHWQMVMGDTIHNGHE
jgi:hypothetical protein